MKRARGGSCAPIALASSMLCCALVACAGSADTRAPAASPEPAAPAFAAPPAQSGPAKKALAPGSLSNDATTPSGAGAATMPQPAAPASPPAAAAQMESAPSSADAARDRSARAPSGRAANELDRAERDIAAGDCATACRALGSMERAVTFLCAQAQEGDTNRCSDAKDRLVASRRRVRTSCGACAGGPSVDPDAPVPSTR